MEKKFTVLILLLISPLFIHLQAQSLKVVASGTGRTTGHIANLNITNNSGAAVRINPQTCYIPSEGKYQPYIATIPGLSVPPGHSVIQLKGYCADVSLPPIPGEKPLPPLSDWIPVIQPGAPPSQGSINILPAPPVPAFKAEDIPTLVKTPGYTPLPDASAETRITWPGTNTNFDGTINPGTHPKPFAPVLVEALNSIIRSYDKLKLIRQINTPFSGQPEKEREAVIQQTLWIYTADITGEQYQKEHFQKNVIKQFEDMSGAAAGSFSTEEKEKLEKGIDDFWNTFNNVGVEAKIFNGTTTSVALAGTSTTLTPPWDKIDLTDDLMKPGYPFTAIATGNKFPWIPVIGGAVGLGTIVYFATQGNDEDDPVDCAFTATTSTTSSTCGLSNGAVVLNVNPAGTYTYQWSNGASTPSLNNIPAGNYSVTVTRTGTTCNQVVSATVSNQNQSFNATIAAVDSDCNQPNGSVSVTPSPPGVYTYQWSNGATTQNISNLPAGNYAVTISAGGSCQRTLSAQVATKPFQPTVSFTTTPSTCGGSDGSATVSVSPPDQYSYAWSNGQIGTSLSNVQAGTYSVTVSKPGTSCTHVANVTVTDLPASFSISISSTNANCGLSNGTASAFVDPPGSYEYVWSNGQTGSQVSGLAEGSYTVTVSITGTSCSEEASVTIAETPASFVVSVTSTQAGCGLSDGTATATVTPPGAYTYAWSNGQTTSQISGLAPGNYTVTVSVQGSDCSKQASTTVGSTSFPNTITFTSTPASCGGADGTATAIVSPPGEFTFLWSNGQTGNQLSGVNAGTYTVTVTITGTNCSKDATITVDELPAAFTASVSSTPSGCGLNNGTATVTVNPPGSYDYVWSNGQTGSQLTGVPGGSYTVTVSIAGTSCSQIVSTTVEQLPPTFTLSFSSSPAGCGLNNGSAAVTVNPPGAYTYLWSNGSTGTQITNVGAGTYTVTVSITGTSCSATGSVNVEQTGGGFTATFATVNADCGLANGSATISVSPPGDYTYQWSNGQSGATLQQVAPGTYSVTAYDEDDCSGTFSVAIGQDNAEYINIINTTPGTCTGGGNISFTITTPGAGPLEVEVAGPEGTNTITLGPGVYNLSTFMSVVPGSYTLTVIDQQIGPTCSETVSATVGDVTPAMELDNDFYTAEGSQPVNENALENDLGFNITMTQVDNEDGGSVTFLPNGDFTFIAEPGFSGEASFVYTVTDACGNTGTAIVTIIVEEVPCDIEVDFDTTPASCGLEDGAITVIVNVPGDYDYEWDNGDSGPTIQNIPPGGYSFTITDLTLGCTFEATVILEGLPADYVDDIELIQPSCEAGGDIEFIAISPGGNTLNMLVEHPFGSGEFEIEAGLIRLSDYVTTTPGEYFVEVSDPEAGPGCSESFTVTLIEPPLPEILVVEVFPPSAPGEMDASAFIEVIDPGQTPYAVYIDGVFAFVVNQNNFFLINLGAGVHTVHLVDIQGCQSNTETFVVPVSQENFSFGVSITDAGIYSASNEQPSVYHPGKIWRNVVTGSYRFDIGNVQQVVRVLYAPSLRMSAAEKVNGFIAMEYLSGPQDLQWKGLGLRAQAGLGTYIEQHIPLTQQTSEPFYWLVRASAEQRILKRILLTGSISAGGWDYIAPVGWEFGFRVPFYSWSKSGGR